MKKQSAHDGKSLRTFFIYTAIVLIFIIVSLSIKAFFIIKSSKFDGTHRFTVAVAKEGSVVEIVSFDPPNSSSSVLQVTNKSIKLSSVGRQLAVPVDATIATSADFSTGDTASSLIKSSLWHFNSVKTNLTLFDLSRLFFLSKKFVEQNKTLQYPQQDQEIDKVISNLFTDDVISQENVSIEVINATDVPGMGKRLSRMLTNLGANVVAISTSHSIQRGSKISYYGESTYTLEKISKLLQLPLEKLDRQPIANIVITVGEDNRDTGKF